MRVQVVRRSCQIRCASLGAQLQRRGVTQRLNISMLRSEENEFKARRVDLSPGSAFNVQRAIGVAACTIATKGGWFGACAVMEQMYRYLRSLFNHM